MINIVGLALVLKDKDQNNVLGVSIGTNGSERYTIQIDDPKVGYLITRTIGEGELFSLTNGEISINEPNFIISGKAPIEFRLNSSGIEVVEGKLTIIVKKNYIFNFDSQNISMSPGSRLTIDSEAKLIEIDYGYVVWDSELLVQGEALRWEVDTWKINISNF